MTKLLFLRLRALLTILDDSTIELGPKDETEMDDFSKKSLPRLEKLITSEKRNDVE